MTTSQHSMRHGLNCLRLEQTDTGYIVWLHPNNDFTLGTYLFLTYTGEVWQVTLREGEGDEWTRLDTENGEEALRVHR